MFGTGNNRGGSHHTHSRLIHSHCLLSKLEFITVRQKDRQDSLAEGQTENSQKGHSGRRTDREDR